MRELCFQTRALKTEQGYSAVQSSVGFWEDPGVAALQPLNHLTLLLQLRCLLPRSLGPAGWQVWWLFSCWETSAGKPLGAGGKRTTFPSIRGMAWKLSELKLPNLSQMTTNCAILPLVRNREEQFPINIWVLQTEQRWLYHTSNTGFWFGSN